tara:strand:- start:1 stop:1140 length:1140 start_codon:yes stop_codon:yes gene_type:complete
MNYPVRPENPISIACAGKRVNYSLGEMYCGPGGLGLGAKCAQIEWDGVQFGFTHSWVSDRDKDSCLTYKHGVLKDEPSAQIICADINAFDNDFLPPVDGFMYGFPCNDFSGVGERKGLNGKFGPLYSYGVDYINKCNPLFILAENVSGISNANSGNAFRKILMELSSAGDYGYDLTTHLYKFEDYGIPQSRHRYIVVGFRNDLDIRFKVPRPTKKHITCREALENPPIGPDAWNNEYTRQSESVVERLKHIKPGENAWTANLPDHLKLHVANARLSMIYKRLDPEKPSYTVTGSGGGGTHVYHYEEPRALTNRERARLQTFPDDFKFYGSKESVRRQIGMSVPVKAAQLILEAILMTLTGISYRSIEPSVQPDSQLPLL